MIRRPPPSDPLTAFSRILERHPEHLADYLKFNRPLDEKAQYLHFDKFRYKVPSHLDEELAWGLVKSSRQAHFIDLLTVGGDRRCKYLLTTPIQKALSMTDRYTTTAVLENMLSNLGEQYQVNYLLNDLVNDEGISSSQLEGAATTTRVAKDMIVREREPRTMDEKMILGNYRMMQFAWEKKSENLSLELIREIHEIGAKGIEDGRYSPGNFRQTDDVVVTDQDENIIHQPPPCKGLEQRLNGFCTWVNQAHDEDEYSYLHPLIKAICVHFVIGYEHPFHDGNGRVARALFYWFMFKMGYSSFRYVSVSVLLKKAYSQYTKSYLYSETDDFDLTYFLDYHCRIITRSIQNFRDAYANGLREIEEFNAWLWKSNLLNKLNFRQRTVFQVAKAGIESFFTANTVQRNLNCSYNTASSVLNGLVELRFFEKQKIGREWVYTMLDKNAIQRSWNT